MENGQAPREVETPLTWFGCISVKNALLVVNTILLAITALWITLMALYMAQHLQTLVLEDLLTSAISLALWAIAVGIIIFGMCAICFQSSGLVEAFFWTQPAHWVLDLASTIVLLVFTYRKKDTLAQASCVNNPSHQICLDLFNGRLIMLTCGLCLYKIIGIYGWYLLFLHRKSLIAREQQSITLRWLRRASTSSISSLFEKKWWSPSQIPVIKIDFASDESSASVYSNDSPGYRNVHFGIPQFPTLAAPPQALFVSHIGGDAMAPGSRDAYADVPSLPYYSVVGSERGALT